MYKFKCLILLIFISSLLLGIGKKNEKLFEEDYIYKNIYIENIDVSSMTKDEALKLVNKTYKLKPIKLKSADKTYTLSPDDINLSFNVENAVDKAYFYTKTKSTVENLKRKLNLHIKDKYIIKLIPTYDEAKLSKILNEICNDTDKEVVNATIKINDNGSIKKTKSKNGRKVDLVDLKESIYNMILYKNLKDIDVKIDSTTPKVLTSDVESINTVLGQFSTTFNHTTSRGSNISIASNSTSDILLLPHNEFSYNNATGSRTWHNGYKSAKVIVGGKYVNGEGGGVCQVSTTIYNAALISGMDIQEVHNHTFISRYAPAGRDAAVSYGYTDFKFINPFKHPIYIKNIVNNGVITSKIYGCNEDREKLYIVTKNNYEGDKIKVDTYRIYLDEEGNKIREELISKNVYRKK
ncbi:MAG: VanW family protein [Paeniclostridium sordellii]|nr:VanW family protein [Paeniclostridium sordellii]